MKKLFKIVLSILIMNTMSANSQSQKVGGSKIIREVGEIRSILTPRLLPVTDIGSKTIPVPAMPKNWDGLVITYDKIFGEAQDLMHSYLVWNTKTKEGIIINPLKKDIQFIIELANKQKGIHWLYIIDTHTFYNEAISTEDFTEGSNNAANGFESDQRFYFFDIKIYNKEKGKENIAVKEVAKQLNSQAIIPGYSKVKPTKASPITVCRIGDAQSDKDSVISWGPFLFMTENCK